jgi:two-component system sporulation sensor kinase C
MVGDTAKDRKLAVGTGLVEERATALGIFDALEDGLLIIDQTLNLLYANPVLERLYGPWKGRKCYEYFELGQSPCLHCPAEAVYRGEKSRRQWHCPKNNRTYDIVDTSVANPDGTRQRVEILRDITDQKTTMRDLEEQTRRLRARVRELACLSAASKMLATAQTGFHEVLHALADLLPPAMADPDGACARITLAGNEITTAGFKETPWWISADIESAGEVLGRLEVFYAEGVSQRENGPFLSEERELVDMLARELAGFEVRRKARMEIAEHERMLNLFLSASPDYTYLTDADGNLLYANAASLNLLGVTLDQAKQINVFSHFITTDPAALAAVAVRVQAGEEVHGFEVTVVLDGGKTIDLEINAVPLTVDGRVTEILSVARDITERQRDRHGLIRQLELLRILMDTLPSPVFYKDTQGLYTGCNPAFEHLVGLKRQDIIGKSVYDIAAREDADEHFKHDSQLLASPGTQTYQWQIRVADGDMKDVVVNKATFAGPDGEVAGLVGVILDITDLKRTESALKQSEETYRCLFEEAPIALVEVVVSPAIEQIDRLISGGITDLEAHFQAHPDDLSILGQGLVVRRANAAALGLNECTTMDEFRQVFARNIVGPAMPATVGTLLAFLRGSTTFDAEHIAMTPQGRERYVRTRAVAIPPGGDRPAAALMSAVDITDLKESEDALRGAEIQLRTYSQELERLVARRSERIRELERQRAAGQRIAATGRMAARIAHEINNPLAGIKNSFLLIKKAVPEDHPRFEYVDLIEREIDRVALIIRKMYELYRPEEQVRRPAQVVESIREVFTLLESSLREKEVNLLYNAPHTPVYASMPVGYLSQVMFNLLKNAIEASPTGGTITVSVEQQASQVVIRVKDEGHGIAPEHRDLIFDPFFTTRSDGDFRGLGLGLSVSKTMIEAMGGTITLETSVGKGTEFTVRFPCNMEADDARSGFQRQIAAG